MRFTTRLQLTMTSTALATILFLTPAYAADAVLCDPAIPGWVDNPDTAQNECASLNTLAPAAGDDGEDAAPAEEETDQPDELNDPAPPQDEPPAEEPPVVEETPEEEPPVEEPPAEEECPTEDDKSYEDERSEEQPTEESEAPCEDEQQEEPQDYQSGVLLNLPNVDQISLA
jgi:outer membrane biosynthesis protein TonB